VARFIPFYGLVAYLAFLRPTLGMIPSPSEMKPEVVVEEERI